MILTHVTIVVKDQNAALEFYTKKLGFEKKADYQNPGQPRWLTVGPKGQEIEMVLWQAGASSDPRLPASHEMPGIGTRWVLEVDDIRKSLAELKAKGVKFKEEQPIQEGWGFAADMLDPDGNPFTLHETRKQSASTDWAKPARNPKRKIPEDTLLNGLVAHSAKPSFHVGVLLGVMIMDGIAG